MPGYVHFQCGARYSRQNPYVSPVQLGYSHSEHAKVHSRISLVYMGDALGIGRYGRLCWVFWDAYGWA